MRGDSELLRCLFMGVCWSPCNNVGIVWVSREYGRGLGPRSFFCVVWHGGASENLSRVRRGEALS